MAPALARPSARPIPTIDAGPARLDADRFSTANRRRLSGPALRTFTAIADLWTLGEGERLLILGLPSRSTYYGWLKAAREHQDVTLGVDVLTRISALLGIHQALGILHADERDGIAWLRRPHRAPLFGGQAPLALVTGGTQDGLMAVRRFLDAARGGLFLAPNAVDRDTAPSTDADIVLA
ncbi:MbcA/ParS/Xre antitoxin family protein [Methylobacterium sp. EM32]|uniref:MbcA/ParS/Xre antitoxin family protein n=1 Tax=Methylobacterium sp. EM32 TaxID=3163481 RepID=UPI0033B7819B